jgi:hypothetical protein
LCAAAVAQYFLDVSAAFINIHFLLMVPHTPGGREHRQSFTPSRNDLHVHCSSRFLSRRVSNIQNYVDDYWRWCRHLAHLGYTYIWAEDSGNLDTQLSVARVLR